MVLKLQSIFSASLRYLPHFLNLLISKYASSDNHQLSLTRFTINFLVCLVYKLVKFA